MISQVTVFLENSEGRLAALCRTLADANVNMSALSVADTAEYGLVRIICNDPSAAVEALEAAGYRAMTSDVTAIAVTDVTGGLSTLMEIFDDADVNVQYGYCFASKGAQAVAVFKISEIDSVAVGAKIAEAGFSILKQEDLA